MPDKNINIVITARNTASAAFTEIASAATRLGDAITGSTRQTVAAYQSADEALLNYEQAQQRATTATQNLNLRVNDFAMKAGFAMQQTLMAIADAGVNSQRVTDQLAQAIQDAGQNYSDYADQINTATLNSQQYGISQNDAKNALQQLVQVVGDTTNAMSLLQVTEDLAAAKHISLASAAVLVGKAYDGNILQLRRMGVELAKGSSGTEVLTALQAKFGGQAEANSTMLSRFTAEMTNWAAAAGVAIGPFAGLIQILPGLAIVFSAAVSGGKLLVAMLESQRAAAALATAAVEVETTATAASTAATTAATAATATQAAAITSSAVVLEAQAAASAAAAAAMEGKAVASAAAADADAGHALEAELVAAMVGAETAALAANVAALDAEAASAASASAALDTQAFAARSAAASLLEQAAAAETAATASESVAVAGERAALAEGGLLASLTGPAGIVIALGVAAAGVAYLIHQHNAESDALKEVTLNVDDLTNAYKALAAAGTIGPSNLGQLFTIKSDVASLSAQRDAELAAAKAQQTAQAGQAVGYNPAVQGSQEAANFQAQIDEQNKITQGQIANEEKLAGSAQGLVAANKELAQIYANLGDSGVDATRVTNELNDAFVKYNKTVADGHPDLATLETDIAAIKAGMYEATKAATDGIDAWTKMTAAMTTAFASVHDPLSAADTEIKHIGASMDATAVSAQTLANDALATFHDAMSHIDPTASAAAQTAAAASAYKALGDTLTAVDKQLSDQEGIHAFTASLGDLVHPVEDANAQITKAVTDVMNATGAVAETQKAVVSRALSELNVELAMNGNDVDAAAASWAKFWNAVNGANTAISADAAKKQIAFVTAQSAGSVSPYMNPGMSASQADIDAFNKQIDDNKKEVAGYITALGQVPTFLDAVASSTKSAGIDAADALTNVNAAAADMKRVIIDNTDAIAKQSDEIFKWADGLIAAQGVYSKIDDLANKHLITGQSGVYTGNNDYANAQKAYNDIAKDNLRIQEDTAVIQAKQAPILAELANKQADYYDKIAKGNATEQEAALGFMDAGEQQKAQTVIALANAAAQGKVGQAGKDAAAAVIQGAADADPVMSAMLQKMGLITVDKHGKVTVRFDGAETVQTAIDNLTNSIKTLDDLLAKAFPTIKVTADTSQAVSGVNDVVNMYTGTGDGTGGIGAPAIHIPVVIDPPSNTAAATDPFGTGGDGTGSPVTITVTADTSQANKAIGDVQANVAATTGKTIDIGADTGAAAANVSAIGAAIDATPDHTSTVTADVYGTGDVEYLGGLIDGLQDKSVSIYATTYYSSVGASGVGVGISSGNMLGGVIQRHASGGVASWLAEAGPELLDFPGGGHGMAYGKGVYTVPDGTFVHTAPATKAMGATAGAVNHNYYAPLYIEPASGSLQDALNQAAINRYRRG